MLVAFASVDVLAFRWTDKILERRCYMKTLRQSMHIAVIVLAGVMCVSGSLLAANFHINPATDSLSESTADGYVGSAIGVVTRELGSPSMIRTNLADSSQMDYIFIGDSNVYAFAVTKVGGKSVTAYAKYGRSDWESSIYPAYPA
jgi:hypothetical protein